jgi:hypothetical protein
MRGVSLVLVLYATASGVYAGPDKPAALLAAERARSTAMVRTAQIEYVTRSTRATSAGLQGSAPRVYYYTWRCAGGQQIAVYQGDEEGVVMRDLDGRPRDDLTYHGPMHFLVDGDEIWQHVQDSPLGDVLGSQRGGFWKLHDLRRWGVDPAPGLDLESTARQLGYTLDYDAILEDGLQVVTVTTQGGKIRWWIDPDKGWSVVRTASWVEDQKVGETRYTLGQIDGVWFPTRVETFRLAEGDAEPSTTVTVFSAEFNRPYHPQKLTPADIGVELGSTVFFQDRVPPMTLAWDGTKAVPFEEFAERVQRGEAACGPTVQRETERLDAERRKPAAPQDEHQARGAPDEGAATRPAPDDPTLSVLAFVAEWEAYTWRFIIQHNLDDERAERAWRLCRECEERARSYVADHRAEIGTWEKEARELGNADVARRTDRQARSVARRGELSAPINRIFDTRLKPSLEKLAPRQEPSTSMPKPATPATP